MPPSDKAMTSLSDRNSLIVCNHLSGKFDSIGFAATITTNPAQNDQRYVKPRS